jgi:hypothetical protein
MNFAQPAQATEWRPKIAHGKTVGFDPRKNKAPDGAKEKIRELFFCRPCRGLFCLVILPTVAPWATFYRASGVVFALILFFSVGAAAQTTNTLSNGDNSTNQVPLLGNVPVFHLTRSQPLSDAEIQGRNLVRQILEQRPTTNSSFTGILSVRDATGNRTNYSFTCEVIVQATNWTSKYTSDSIKPRTENLLVNHADDSENIYSHFWSSIISRSGLSNDEFSQFANSDFWLCDLGLEFFHWPAQKILPKPTNLVRGREYTLLESTNPNPSTNGYSRVLSSIDKETGGILEAEAYDSKGELLKVFEPKSFKKVNGQWELQEMEIRNVQTGSRTRLEFDLKK